MIILMIMKIVFCNIIVIAVIIEKSRKLILIN